jgi:hypothetical protein
VPALPAVPQTVKLKVDWKVGGDLNAVTILHAHYTGGPLLPADTLHFATATHAAIVAQFGGIFNPSVSLEGVECTDLSSSSGAQSTYSATHAGTRAGGPLGPATCVLTSWIITRRYRGGKPRSYWPFFSDNDLAADLSWMAGSVTAMQTATQLFYNDMVAITSGTAAIDYLSSVSYYSGFTSVLNPITGRTKDVSKLRTAGPVVDKIVSFATNPRPASQRRRNLQRL